jgi:hypothetical protein
MMNRKQRRIIGLAALVLAGMILFPPFHEVSASGRVWGQAGYHFIGLAPKRAQVDVGALLWQVVALSVATAGLLFMVKD